MSTNTLQTLLDRLSQRTGDYLSETVTTVLTTSKVIICTDLADYAGYDNIYKPGWVYIVDESNVGEYRRVDSYDHSATQITVLGANFVDDGSDKAVFEWHRYDRRNKIRALNMAARESFPHLFRIIRDITLSGNNIAPNPSFEDWSSSSYPDYWTTLSNATAAEETTNIRGIRGSSSVKVTASAANGYIELNSDTFPKLLDLMGGTVSAYVWAHPETANDATIVIYTKQADGTTQTLTSTTATPAGESTLIKHENQELKDDLVEVRIRLKVATKDGYCYFDNFRINGVSVHEYLLPLDFQNPLTRIDKVSIQTTTSQDEYEDDLMGHAQFTPLYGWDTADDATTKYLVFDNGVTLPTGRLLKIEGRAPLESNLSATTSTMTIEDPYIDLLIELAASKLFNIEAGLPSAGDRDFLRAESYKYLASYNYMAKSLKMPKPQSLTRFRSDIL